LNIFRYRRLSFAGLSFDRRNLIACSLWVFDCLFVYARARARACVCVCMYVCMYVCVSPFSSLQSTIHFPSSVHRAIALFRSGHHSSVKSILSAHTLGHAIIYLKYIFHGYTGCPKQIFTNRWQERINFSSELEFYLSNNNLWLIKNFGKLSYCLDENYLFKW